MYIQGNSKESSHKAHAEKTRYQQSLCRKGAHLQGQASALRRTNRSLCSKSTSLSPRPTRMVLVSRVLKKIKKSHEFVLLILYSIIQYSTVQQIGHKKYTKHMVEKRPSSTVQQYCPGIVLLKWYRTGYSLTLNHSVACFEKCLLFFTLFLLLFWDQTV